jgi:hypothetical protein
MPLLPVDVGGQQKFMFACNGGLPVRLSASRVISAFTLPIFPADNTLRVCSNTSVLNNNILNPEVYLNDSVYKDSVPASHRTQCTSITEDQSINTYYLGR